MARQPSVRDTDAILLSSNVELLRKSSLNGVQLEPIMTNLSSILPTKSTFEHENLQIDHSEDTATVAVAHSQQNSIEVSSDGTRILSTCVPTHTACQGYDGVLHIRSGDYGGASGTIFFQFVIGQLIYADKYNLLPWIHLDDFSYLVFDPDVHGNNSTPGVTVELLQGMSVSTIQDARRNHAMYPGPPEQAEDTSNLQRHTYKFPGTGVWNHYFHPISDFCPGDRSCANRVPYITMENFHISPGLHRFAPWSPKIWRYGNMLDFVAKPHIPLSLWLLPQRQAAAAVVEKYNNFRLQPWLANMATELLRNGKCLGLHIRWSDKAGTRRRLGLEEFLPFVQEYWDQVHAWKQTSQNLDDNLFCVYLATDSQEVLDKIKTAWPQEIYSALRVAPAMRSSNETNVFSMYSHHRTNTEVLRDIFDLSRCEFLIGGKSAVTESAMYWNSKLIFQSVNLEDSTHLSPTDFGRLVGKVLRGDITFETWKKYQVLPEWWQTRQTLRSTPQRISIANSEELCEKVDHRTVMWNITQPLLNRPDQWTAANVMALRLFVHLPNALHHVEEVQRPQQGDAQAQYATVYDDALWRKLFDTNHWDHPSHDEQDLSSPTLGSTGCSRVETVTANTVQQIVYPSVAYFQRDKANQGAKRVARAGQPMLSVKTNSTKYIDWLQQTRTTIQPIISKYYKSGIRQHITNRVNEILQDLHTNKTQTRKVVYPMFDHLATNGKVMMDDAPETPMLATIEHSPCLGVHIPDPGYHRNRKTKRWQQYTFPQHIYLQYIDAYRKAGGTCMYLATNSYSIWNEFTVYNTTTQEASLAVASVNDQFQITIHGQETAVRNREHIPIHYMESDNLRIASEILVDVISLSRTVFLLHGTHSISDGALFWNDKLGHVHVQDPNRLSVAAFEAEVRQRIRTLG